jgi:hypothetical protein
VLWSFVKAMGIDMDMLLLEDEDELPMSMLDISWFILGGCVLRGYDRLCSRAVGFGSWLICRVQSSEGCRGRFWRGKMSRSL